VDEYKQRLFNWLVKNAPALHDWCVSKSIHSAVPTVTVSRQDLKLKF
jgi:hypothetical protein